MDVSGVMFPVTKNPRNTRKLPRIEINTALFFTLSVMNEEITEGATQSVKLITANTNVIMLEKNIAIKADITVSTTIECLTILSVRQSLSFFSDLKKSLAILDDR